MDGTTTEERPTQHHTKCEHGACRSECPVLAWSRALYRTQPYREPSKPEEPLTDREMELWDTLVCALTNRHNSVNTAAKMANFADDMMKERRKRFGVR